MHKHTWWLFLVIASVGTVMALASSLDPSVMLEMLEQVGPPLPAGVSRSDPFLYFLVRWTTTALLGGNVLTLFIAANAYRRHERWAGFALLYWPLMFLSHLVMYRFGPMSFVQVAWLTLSTVALALHFRVSRHARERAPLTAAATASRLA